jgi:hypothetical protein
MIVCSLLSYLFCGALHEGAHLLVASLLLPDNNFYNDNQDGGGASSWPLLWLRTVLGRQSHILFTSLSHDQTLDDTFHVFAINWIRHAGWIFSCSLALFLHWYFGKSTQAQQSQVQSQALNSSNTTILILRWAAYATAVDAIATDLVLPLFHSSALPVTESTNSCSPVHMIFWCGNFGLILLNPAWIQHEKKSHGSGSAMQILKDMIRVTMMRGAQSGGVLTFDFDSVSPNQKQVKATRSRVVNRKRTSLSEKVIAKVQQDNRYFRNVKSTQKVKTFSGKSPFIFPVR